MSAWQPIETAPDSGEFHAGYWWRDKWLTQTCKMRLRPTGLKVIEARSGWAFPATHWMPLPPAPDAA